ncbi:glycine zipper 2TM domain-containing protein [Parvibaculum sp.]|uniref:glycine zipper 2TM domain-containing protein n=1 Tax=Parvibaculum sp. TaxID=2024848 RepID=UPI001B1E7599|nr:glycine zipper 2TM domain-containing protein [Parvibaculum sp.]MBO6634253.1 glycine zipper 2TM domain-containing protein [Parvibaculum sp.]MBO6678815.1 glycine zipper 2TM domain-containing protein [Parvibaculum sp.]
MVVYRNIHHIVTIPQPVYVEHIVGYDDYYYSGPYAGYDSVYRYDEGYGYGYRRSACNSDAVGAVIGAVLGGVIGADQGRGAGPVIGGALIGAVLGGVLGSAIDASNQACVGDVLEYVPSNQPVYWEDPSNGYGYEVTPMRTYEPHPGQYCREYQTVVTIGGRAEQAYGTACRQPDGTWKTVNS